MIKTKIYYIILLIFFFSSCGSKKTFTEYKERVIKDTIYKSVTKTVLKSIKDTLLIEQPCDSLGGLKPFKTTLKNEKASIIIENVKGDIKATVNIDSILNVKEEYYRSKYKSKIEYKEKIIVKYKTPFWIWVYIVLSALVIFLLFRFK